MGKSGELILVSTAAAVVYHGDAGAPKGTTNVWAEFVKSLVTRVEDDTEFRESVLTLYPDADQLKEWKKSCPEIRKRLAQLLPVVEAALAEQRHGLSRDEVERLCAIADANSIGLRPHDKG